MKISALSYALPALACVMLGCTAAPSAPAQGDVEEDRESSATTLSVQWQFASVEEADDAGSPPQQSVMLVLAGSSNQSIPLGTYTGTCSATDPADLQQATAIAGAMCWFAGGGDEFLVQRTAPDTLQISHRTVDEGTAEEAAPEQPWLPLGAAVSISADAVIE